MDVFQLFYSIVLPIFMVLIMAGMGMSLNAAAFLHLFRHPKPALLGLFAQMILLPAIALAFITLIPMPTHFVMGLLLLASCPGGIPSNLVAFVARADVALSVSLTAINSVLMVVSMPLVLMLGAQLMPVESLLQIDVPAGLIFKQLILLALLPVVSGMAVGHFFPAFAARCEPLVRKISLAVLVALVVILLAQQYEFFIDNVRQSAGLLIAFIVSTMTVGAVVARLAKLPKPQTETIMIEVGMQNTILAVYVASNILKDERLVLLPTAYGFLCLFVIAGMLYVYRKFFNNN